MKGKKKEGKEKRRNAKKEEGIKRKAELRVRTEVE